MTRWRSSGNERGSISGHRIVELVRLSREMSSEDERVFVPLLLWRRRIWFFVCCFCFENKMCKQNVRNVKTRDTTYVSLDSKIVLCCGCQLGSVELQVSLGWRHLIEQRCSTGNTRYDRLDRRVSTWNRIDEFLNTSIDATRLRIAASAPEKSCPFFLSLSIESSTLRFFFCGVLILAGKLASFFAWSSDEKHTTHVSFEIEFQIVPVVGVWALVFECNERVKDNITYTPCIEFFVPSLS